MAVPKKRTSKSKRNMRRAHDFLTRTYSIVCSNCGNPTLPHHMCGSCGYYRGRQIKQIQQEAQA